MALLSVAWLAVMWEYDCVDFCGMCLSSDLILGNDDEPDISWLDGQRIKETVSALGICPIGYLVSLSMHGRPCLHA